VSLQLPGFIDEGTAGNARGQLARSGVWVQVAEILQDRAENSNTTRLRKEKDEA
jgi:hypothetical protein